MLPPTKICNHIDLSARRALVTGAGDGAGREVALALAGSGASVAVSDINIERAEALVEIIEVSGGRAIALHADVSNRFQAANIIEQTRDAFGGLDILVNAAEIFHPEPLLTIDEWSWRRQLEVNITGAFFCLQLAARVMADEGGGIIINLITAEALKSTIPAGVGHIAGKAAVAAMTRQAARELAPSGIQVYGIALRQYLEDRQQSADGGETVDDRSDIHADIGGCALFLCSKAARTLSGQAFLVDSPPR